MHMNHHKTRKMGLKETVESFALNWKKKNFKYKNSGQEQQTTKT